MDIKENKNRSTISFRQMVLQDAEGNSIRMADSS